MKSAKRIWKFFFWPLVAFVFFRQIDDIGKFGMEDAVMLWPGWASVATYWYISVGVYALVCLLVYGLIKAYSWIKLKLVMPAIAGIKAAQAAANANQPGAGNPQQTAQGAQAADAEKVMSKKHWILQLAIYAILCVFSGFMAYLYIKQLAKNSEMMEANYSVESKIIKKQQEIAQQFGVPLPAMTTEAQVEQVEPLQLFINGGCDFFNRQVPKLKQKYLLLVKGTPAGNACTIDGNTIPEETGENYSIEPTEPEPTVTPPVTKPKTKPVAPATSAQVYKPAVKADTRTGTGRPTYGSSYVPPTANVQYGEYQGAQGNSSGNNSSEGTVYLNDDPNPPKQENNSDGNTVYFQ